MVRIVWPPRRRLLKCATFVLILVSSASVILAQPKPIVIAHRGASGYLPEHSEGAKVLAAALGADFLEQDVVLTKDQVPIVCHDITLESTTDIAEVYPNRNRQDGHFYAADFRWDELQLVRLNERRDSKGLQVYPNRFPGGFGQRILSLKEELQLIDGLSKTLQRSIGLYIELKRPTWHREDLKVDIADAVWNILVERELGQASSKVFLQCFEAEPLQKLRLDKRCELPLIQLLSADDLGESGSWPEEMKRIAQYARGIGPSIDMLVDVSRQGELHSNGLVEAAHASGLLVHPYTVRQDSLPKWTSDLDQLHRFLFSELQVDGVFSDFPDLTIKFLQR
jgi:glycerophosphoryl diester phosphodiesterase